MAITFLEYSVPYYAVTKANDSEFTIFTMMDACIDIDAMGRKELQALAKNFGIKANQKSVVLRDELRVAIAPDKQSSFLPENDHGDDKCVQPESSIEKVSIVCEAEETTKSQNKVHHSAEGRPTEGFTDARCQIKEVDRAKNERKVIVEESELDENAIGKNKNIVDQNITISYENIKNSVKTEGGLKSLSDNISSSMNKVTTVKAKENLVQTSEAKALSSNGPEIKSGYDDNDITIKNNVATENDRIEIDAGNHDSFGKGTKGIKQSIALNQKLSATSNKIILSTKISFGSEKSSIKKYSHANRNKNEKFVSRLDVSYRKIHVAKEHSRAKPPKKVGLQPAEERLKTSSVQKREVPLWKVHSRDFIRPRGRDKTRGSNFKKKKNPSPTKHLKRRPFGDRSNNEAETNITKKTGEKDGIKRIPPKPQPISRRNEDQMKLFLERQSVGRKDRARKEQVKKFANSVRS